MKNKNAHNGSSFDSFLEEEGIREEVEAVAVKRVLAWHFSQAMQRQHKSKVVMARKMRTSRTQIERLLDPANTAVSLAIITRAAYALGKTLTIKLSDKKKDEGAAVVGR